MTYRSLLVPLDQTPLGAPRVQSALRLAKSFDSHLVGVSPTGMIDVSSSLGSVAALSDLSALAWDLLRDQAEVAAQGFRDVCRASGLASYETQVDESDEAVSLLRRAHCADLVVMSQADPAAPNRRRQRDILEQVILQSGRPTLILPSAGPVGAIGSKIVIAWDDSREASRAVSDALPLLRQASHVYLLGWAESGEHSRQGLNVRLDAFHQWLMRHGVNAELEVKVATDGIAGAVLSRATQLCADLIVMGAYGHARWAERLLGGATRGLLDAMTVPVLMSH
jgi:nucleotide-binding universal stress UspA family protein